MLTLATWNINSVRMRLPRLLDWLQRRQPSVVCLQETKVVDEDFPAAPLAEAGYQCIVNGQKAYNGVAILTKFPARDVVRALPGDASDSDCRMLSATIEGMRIFNMYAPNGQSVESEKYRYKLAWFQRLRAVLDGCDPKAEVLLCGDFNVAPEDLDVWDPEQWRGQILCSDPERGAFGKILEWGFVDTLRFHHPEAGVYTWWNYRGGAFHRGWGMRIDHILASAPLARRCTGVEVDREERKGEKPSDHAPVIASFS